ncbi:MAG: ABC transporter ATP-binding protein [Chloroflexota bacterium]
MSIIELKNLAKSYGKTPVLKDVTLEVEPGDFMVVYGLPTSGKSVLVRVLTGLEKPSSGQIILRGQDVTTASAGERNIGYVPQSFALYPHMSVFKNIAYPLTLTRTPKAEIQPAVEQISELLGIRELLDRKPDQLSGGQKQRVAIARGLVKQTEFYILDDPLVGLDFKLRERLIDDLKETQQTLGVTFLYTTSDAVETMMLAQNIAVLDDGVIVESGPPDKLYELPERASTMKYVGFPQANFLSGTLSENGSAVETAIFNTNVPASSNGAIDGEISIGIRPEHINLTTSIPDNVLTSQAKVLLREDLGGEEIVYLDVDGTQLTTVLRSDDQSQEHVEIDQDVTFWVRPDELVIFAGGERVGVGR